MLFLNGMHRQTSDREIAVDAPVEGLEAKIRCEIAGELQLDGTVDGLEVGSLAGILPKGDFDRTVDGVRGAGARDVVHLDVAINVTDQEAAIDVAHGNAALVDGLDFDVNVAGDLNLKIHFDNVALEFAVAATVVAVAAERAVDVELQQALLFGDVESNFLARQFEFFLGFRANGFVDRELGLAGICTHDFDGTPDVVDFERAVSGRHRERLLDLFVSANVEVVVSMVEVNVDAFEIFVRDVQMLPDVPRNFLRIHMNINVGRLNVRRFHMDTDLRNWRHRNDRHNRRLVRRLMGSLPGRAQNIS